MIMNQTLTTAALTNKLVEASVHFAATIAANIAKEISKLSQCTSFLFLLLNDGAR